MTSPSSTPPTPYPDVNAILARLLDEVRAVLGAEFVGLYLYGSLASGDFDPASSDIDFLVVTAHILPEPALHALEAMHARIAAAGGHWAQELEGSYIPVAALRRHDPAQSRHPSIGIDWKFDVYPHGSEWVIGRSIVREMGVVVAGPPPRTLIDPVTPEDLRAAVCEGLRGFWAQQSDQSEWLRPRNYQAFAVLTMGRALYTLEHGTLASKPVAARWAQTALGAPWAAQIARALSWRHDMRPDDLAETLAFIRYARARCPPPLAAARVVDAGSGTGL